MATARSMDLPLPSMERATTARQRFWRAKPGTADYNGTQQGVAPYVAQGAPKVNFNVGTRIYMATARTMDLRPLRRNDHDRAGMIWEAKPGTANENGCQQDVPPYAAQGAPKVNFNVRKEK